MYRAAPDARIHPSAQISDDVSIGAGTQVWDLVRIREGSIIGDECILGRGAYIDAGVTIGDRVKIQNDALVYHGVTVASGVFIGPGAILTNDRYPRSVTADGQLARAEDWLVSEIHLAEGCSIGAGAVVVAGSDVGSFALIGAGAVVTRAVPDYALVVGNPGRLRGWVCRCGQRLVAPDGEAIGASYQGPASCPMDHRRYRIDDQQHCLEVPS